MVYDVSHDVNGRFSGAFLTGHQLPNGHTRGVRLSPIYIVVGVTVTDIGEKRGRVRKWERLVLRSGYCGSVQERMSLKHSE